MDDADFAAPSATKVEKASRNDLLAELGSTGITLYTGRPDREFLPDLRGDRAPRLYREMADNDPVIGALLFAIEMLLRQVRWHIEPGKSADISEFVDSCLSDMETSWDETLSSILSMLIYGWSLHEIVYWKRDGRDEEGTSAYDDGKIGWRKLAYRVQESRLRWEFDERGNMLGMVQSAPPTYTPVTIPAQKFVLFRTTTAYGPEGRSILRNAFIPWYYKKHIESVEAIGAERDLAGLPVGYIPVAYLSNTATAEQRAAADEFKRIIRSVKRNEQEGLLWPLAYDTDGNQMFRIELLNSGGARQFNTDQIISRHDQRIAMVVLADFILLGHEKIGSFALGASKVDLFTSAIESWARAIAAEINRQAIPRLLRLNGMPTREAPRLAFDRVQQVNLAELADYLSKLAGAGAPIFPDESLESYLRDVAGLPGQGQ